MSDFIVTLRIKGDGASAIQSVERVQKATDKLGDSTEKTAAKSEKAWAKSGAVVGAAVASIITGVAALAQKSANVAEELGKMSQKTGFTVEALSALKYQAGTAGVNIEQLDTFLSSFSKQISSANAGVKSSSLYFKGMGINIKEASGNLKPTSVLLEEVADKFQGMADGAVKVDLATKLFGQSGVDLIPILNGGSKAIRENAEEAKKLGQIYTTETAKAAGQFNDNLGRLKASADGLGNKIITLLLPSFVSLTDELSKGAMESGIFDSAAEGLAATIEFVVRVFIVAKGVIEQVVNILAAGVETIVATVSVLWDTGKALISFGQAMVALQMGNYAAASNLAKSGAENLSKSWISAGLKVEGAFDNAGAGIKDSADKTRALLDALDEPAKRLAERGAQFKNVIGGVVPASKAAGESLVDLARTGKEAVDKTVDLAQSVSDAIGKIASLGAGFTDVESPVDQEYKKYAESVMQVSAALTDANAKIALEYAETQNATLAKQQYTIASDAANASIVAANVTLDQHIAKITESRDFTSLLNKEYAIEAGKIGLSGRALSGYNAVIAVTTRVQAAYGKELQKMPGYLENQQEAAKANAEQLFDASEKANSLKNILSEFGEVKFGDTIQGQMEQVKTAFAEGKIGLEEMNFVLGQMSAKANVDMLGGFKAMLGVVKTFTKEGSKGYRDMEKGMAAISIIQDIIALKAAVTAVIHQGTSGEPYSAFARMATMAAAVAPYIASIGVSLGSFAGGGFTDTAKQRQETQGTGSVLGDAKAQSESIANGVEITAAATSSLVGINRGMLNALNTLVQAISSAATLLARNGANADFSGQNLAVASKNPLGIPVSESILDPFGWLGGKSKITDQGIIVFGGALSDLLSSIAVGAYQEVQSTSWIFGGKQTNEGIVPVSDEFGKQFQLVITSIVDTVKAAAEALGILPADIQAALDEFKIAETRISLKDLSAEDQQAAIQAVFSQIFDGLAGAVVPFIGQFQQIGEGLGETLIRVATEVQVMQQAIKYLGLSLDETDPEKFAQISDSLIQMVGGIDAFIQGMQKFTNSFATDEFKLKVASEEIASALAEVGLTVPKTKDEMFALMQTLDATTEEGRKQIATLIRLADTSNTYYNLTKKATDEANKFLESIGLGTRGLSDFAKSIMLIKEQTEEAIKSANTLAVVSGRQSASISQLTKIRLWSLAQEAAAIRKLSIDTQDLIAKLFGGIPGSLDGINERISELENASSGVAGNISDIQDASNSLFESWMAGVKTVQDYLDSMLLGDLSALTPEEQLAEAQRQLIATQQRALGGDANALNELPQLADAFLRLLRESQTSGADYNNGFQWVRDLLQSVVGAQNPGKPGSRQPPVELVPSAELIELYAARDAAQGAADAMLRADMARQLVQNIADMATLLKVSVFDFMNARDVDLRALSEALGVNFENIDAQSVIALGYLATTLGVSMTTLTDQLGIKITDLNGGLTELATSVGINLNKLTVDSTQSLAALAGSVGLTLTEISTSLGVNLGELTDATSLINQGLGAEINALPVGQRDELQPLFQAITDATNEADANTAIAALSDAVNLIGGETANALAPYLDGVFPVRALEQLDYLEDLQRIAGLQLDTLSAIRSNLAASNVGSGLPSYAVGTGYVNGDQIANIHNGEAIVPANVNEWFRTSGWKTGGGDSDRVVKELQSVNARLEMIERNNSSGQAKIVQSVESGNEKARNQRDDISRKQLSTARS